VDKAYGELTTPSKRRRIVVLQRKTADPRALQQARSLGKDVFAIMGPDGEDALSTFLRSKLDGWHSQLSRYKTLAETGQYPGQAEITEGSYTCQSPPGLRGIVRPSLNASTHGKRT